jgi:hypothetical protein
MDSSLNLQFMKQSHSNSIKRINKVIFSLILALTPMFASAQLIAGLSANAGSTFKGLGYSSSGAGFKLSLGYEIQDWVEIDIQAQHYWLSSPSYDLLNSMALNAKIIPFSTNIKPYIAFAGGIGNLCTGKLKFDDNVIVFNYDTWLLKPQMGLLMDSGLLKGLLVDFNLFYESNKFQKYQRTHFDLYGVNLGLRYRFSFHRPVAP